MDFLFNFKRFTTQIKVALLSLSAVMVTACPSDNSPVLSKAQLQVQPVEIDFGDTDTQRAFTIKNIGQQNLTWTISEDIDWIVNFQNTSGKISGVGESQITVKIDRSKLKASENSGKIQVTATADDGGQLEGGSKDVAVKATKGTKPKLTMSDNFVTEKTQTTAKAKGFIDNIGSSSITQHGHIWSTARNPSIDDGSDASAPQRERSTTGEFQSSLTGLKPNTTYYIRAYATNAEGTSYSSEVSFKTLVLGANNLPTDISLNNRIIAENAAVNTVIGTLTTTDPNVSDSHTYTLVSGTADFNISGNRLQASKTFDYETKNSYAIRIRTSDGKGGTFEKDFTITVTDVNENINRAPTDIALTKTSITENNSVNAIIGTLTTTDADASDSHTYTLVSGGSDFNLNGNQLRASKTFEYETKNSYAIRIRTSDGKGGTFEKNFTIRITDIPGLEVTMITVTGGTFEMGCKSGRDNSCDSDEKPLHSVTVSTFKLSKYEITNAQYVTFLNAKGVNSNGSFNDPIYGNVQYIGMDDPDVMITHNGSKFVVRSHSLDLNNYPVIEVTWYGANAYCKWAGGRLPTAAEWEFAARGGTSSRGYQFSGSNTIGDVAWYWDNSNSSGQSNYRNIRTHPVGTKAANELGFHDMSGNVWEWCADWYGVYSSGSQTNPTGPSSGSSRVLRGGSWSSSVRDARVPFALTMRPAIATAITASDYSYSHSLRVVIGLHAWACRFAKRSKGRSKRANRRRGNLYESLELS